LSARKPSLLRIYAPGADLAQQHRGTINGASANRRSQAVHQFVQLGLGYTLIVARTPISTGGSTTVTVALRNPPQISGDGANRSQCEPLRTASGRADVA